YRMLAGGPAPRYVRLRARANLANLIGEERTPALPDSVSRYTAKTTVEILNLRPAMSYGLARAGEQQWPEGGPVMERAPGQEMLAARSYREGLFQLVGERDPLDVLARTGDALGEIVKEHATVTLRTRPFEGKWTPNEIMGHLTDSEWVYGYRVRRILCEPKPI